MKVNISTIGKFHTFDLARELYADGMLGDVFTGYPHFKLKSENIPREKIRSYPYFVAPYMTRVSNFITRGMRREWEWLSSRTFENFVAKNIDPCDIYVGLSGSSLLAGIKVKSLGGRYVCDRGSTHIRFQSEILVEEGEIIGLPYSGVDPRVIEQEENEYNEADLITVPSNFNVESFINQGISREKIKMIPYGVSLSKFHPVSSPCDDGFDVLYVGAGAPRKGIHYLIDAFEKVEAAQKTLHIVGVMDNEYLSLLKNRSSWRGNIKIYGAVPQLMLKGIMSSSHVMVLASIEEGLAMVQAQAMACGCPVIATENTGARDLYDDGVEGYIVPIRNTDALTERMQVLADDRELRKNMSLMALAKIKSIGGWRDYGRAAIDTYCKITGVIE